MSSGRNHDHEHRDHRVVSPPTRRVARGFHRAIRASVYGPRTHRAGFTRHSRRCCRGFCIGKTPSLRHRRIDPHRFSWCGDRLPVLWGRWNFRRWLAAGLLTAVGLTFLASKRHVHHDTALAVLLTGLFAIGVVLVSREKSYTSDLTAFLFGRIRTVTTQHIVQTAVVTVLVLLVLLALRKELMLYAFDADGARALGYRLPALDLALNATMALTVVAAVHAVGTMLVLALLVIPATTRRR